MCGAKSIAIPEDETPPRRQAHAASKDMTRKPIRRATRFALWSLLTLPVMAAAASGTVVAEVEAAGAFARAGVQPGDEILSCDGGDLGWPVRTSFDLLECEWELAPRGPVRLRVARAGDEIELIVPAGDWQVVVRPSLDADGEALWRSGLAQIEKGDVPPPAWRQLEEALENAGADRAVGLWLILERAARLRQVERFDEAAGEIARALASGTSGGSTRLELAALWAQRQLLETRGASVELRLENAERLLRSARRLDKRPLIACLMSYHVGWHQTRAKRLDEARSTFAAALQTVRETVPGDSRLQGRLESYLGNVAMTGGDLVTAERWIRQSLKTLEAVQPESRIHAWTYGNLGILESRRGRSSSAIAAYERQIAIYRALGHEANAILPLSNLSSVLERQGDFHRSDTVLAEALAILEKTPDLQESTTAAAVLGNRGYLHLSWGRLRTAAEYNAEAHRILDRLGEGGQRLARSHARLGHVARYRGDLEGAEKHYLRALSIYEEVGDASGVASHLSNLGNLARQRRDFETALALYTRALADLEPGGTYRPRILSNLGRTHLLLGQPDQAAPFLEESLELKRELSPENLDVAASLMLFGDLERSRGKLDAAEARYRAALELHSRLVPGRPAEAENQVRLGQLLLDRGDLSGAEPLLAAAVAAVELRASGTNLAADALYHLARLRSTRGGIKRALDLHRRAVEALDVQWQKLGGSRDARLSWMHAHADYYRALLELLVEEGHEEEAFDLLQRFRARGLRDILARRDLDLPADARARAIENRLVDLARERESLLRKLGADASDEELRSLRSAVAGLRSRRERLLGELRVAAPELARLKYPAALPLSEIGAALDDGTVMISFSVGRDRTLAFVLRREGTGRVDLDVKRLPIQHASLEKLVADFRRSIEHHLPSEVDDMHASGATLYEQLLAPLNEGLEDAERVLVAPDGPLHALPFAALRREGRYLIEWKPVHLAPSATVYADLTRLTSGGRKSVAFGDPAFDESEDGAHVVRGTELKRLPGTRREIEAFRRALPPPVETFVGRQATEERVKQLSDERLIHFASHALVNQDLPLDSALALARSPSSGRDNGLLYAWEVIEQMRLATSLVTLSACETALGREVRGEGILGLVWAFHYAGAKSVIASLWNVEDRSTSDLMAELYSGLAAGLDKDQALRRAQLRQLQASSPAGQSTARGVGGLVPKDAVTTAHPFYWAAFQLYGPISP